MSQTEELLVQGPEAINQRFLMLIQAMSGIRALTSLDINDIEETELLEHILAILIQNLDLDRCSIFMLEGEMLHCAVGKDWNDYIQRDRNKLRRQYHTFKIGEGPVGIAAKNRRLYHSHHCRVDGSFIPIINSSIDRRSGSLICAPIMIGQELLGVLNISHPQPDFFHAWQEHIVVIHANILAQMLHNHRLMNNIRREVKKRTHQLELALKEAEDLKSKFETLSLVDELTQLPNRRYFFMEASQALSQAIRYSHPLSVLLLDVDYFKRINDCHSHECGDNVLRDLGLLLKQQVRERDIVARMGGEEFVIVLTDTCIDGAKAFAARIREAIGELSWCNKDERFNITASIGITSLNHRCGKTGEMLDQLLRESDTALYHCKSQGRDRVKIFSGD